MFKKTFIFSMFIGSAGLALPNNNQHIIDFKAGISSSMSAMRAFKTLGISIYIYRSNIHNLEYNTEEYKKALEKSHIEVAKNILKICQKNEGVYLKIGQYISTMEKMLPKQYTEILGILQDQVNPKDYEEIKIVFEHDFGLQIEEVFEDFDKQSIGSASLAQVHKAKLKDSGVTVAVKLQYPSLRVQSIYDRLVLRNIAQLTNYCLQIYGYKDLDLYKCVSHFEKSMFQELDFDQELQNGEKTRKNFENYPNLYIPYYVPQYCSKRVITMEFVEGIKITDLDQINKRYGESKSIGKQLVDIFGKMIFVDGHIHCDAHSGNIFIRDMPGKNSKPQPQIILLDHGFYCKFDEEFRNNFCNLWYNLCTVKNKEMKKFAQKLGMGDYYRFLPILFIGKTVNSTKEIGANHWTEEEKQFVVENDEHNLEKLTNLMQSLPQDIFYILRSIILIQLHNLRCGGDRKDRIDIFSKYCLQALSKNWNFLQSFTFRFKFHLKIYLFNKAFNIYRFLFGFYIVKIDENNKSNLEQISKTGKCPFAFN